MIKFQKDKWLIIALSECSIFQRGVTYSKKDEVDSNGLAILRANNINLETKRLNFDNLRFIGNESKVKESQRLKKNDILICMASGSLEHIGKIAQTTDDTRFYAGGFMGILRPKTEIINPIILFNILLSARFSDFILKRRVGTNIQNLKFSDIEGFVIPLPPLNEQKQIAALFQSIDNAMEQAEKQEKKLTLLRKNLASDLVSSNTKFGNLLNSENCNCCKLGDIACESKKHTRTPLNDGIERFVGLEHIDPENLKIQRWGNIADGTTFTKIFKKGEVMFGRRRAYLKKAACADFDGLCSGDITVLKANMKWILPELLIYYISSDPVFDYAVKNSAGSLSPRAKWHDLSKYELDIPDLKTQDKILEIFLSIDLNIEQNRNQWQSLKKLKQKLLNEILG